MVLIGAVTVSRSRTTSQYMLKQIKAILCLQLQRVTTFSRNEIDKLVEEIAEEIADYLDPHPRRVMTWRQWRELNGLSKSTANRLKNRGEGPETVQLSERREGVTELANIQWQRRRIRRDRTAAAGEIMTQKEEGPTTR